ncbi:unnamed protein product [Lymnaea stagnalis]|uniref:Major facilitator superfamily (MFS) profile domain-containing protein n=1 Tax=Lymnaea stagnalis TaxID=6523 RepID=A0AAV2IMY6_LYMST
MINEDPDDIRAKEPLLPAVDNDAVNEKVSRGQFYDSIVSGTPNYTSHITPNYTGHNTPDYISRRTPTPVLKHLVSTSDEDAGEQKEDKNSIRVYKRRWYILIMYSTYTCLQSIVWNTWGPISTSCEEAFGWSNETIAMLSNWGPIAYVVFGLFYPWLQDVKGLRWAVVSSMLLVTIGAGFRVITSEPGTATILIHIGQILCGIGGPVSMGSIPAISATWFPSKERVTATSISACINTFGVAISFIVGPYIVTTQPFKNTTSVVVPHNPSHTGSLLIADMYSSEPANVTAARIQQERDEIMLYMYIQCGVCALVFLIMLAYFPAKPPHPPCASAITSRESYWSALWSLRNKGHFILIAVIYGVSLGVLNSWSSVLNVNLDPFGVSEYEAGWIGFYATVGACLLTLLVGRFADWFARQMKLFILIMFVTGACCFVVFALVLVKVIHQTDAILYATIIGGNSLLNAAVPLIYELGCELAYPTSEGAANGLLTLLNNLGGVFFLAVFMIPRVGTMWMNWALIGSIVVSIPLIVLLKSRFNRLEVDEGVQTQIYVEQEVNIASPQSIQA